MLNNTFFDAVGRASTLGLHLVSGVIVGVAIGYLLDSWLDTTPWCFFFFLGIGIIAGFRNMLHDARLLLNSSDKSQEASAQSKNSTDRKAILSSADTQGDK